MKDKKYWLCEFEEINGEYEYFHHYIYSDKKLKELKVKNTDKDDYKLLNHYFGGGCKKKNWDSSCRGYWNNGIRIIRFMNMQEVKPSQFKTLEMAGIYLNEVR